MDTSTPGAGGSCDGSCRFAVLLFNAVKEPKSFAETSSSNEATEWRIAMDGETKSLHAKCTWELSSLPPGGKPLKNKWVFKLKKANSAEPEIYKARLVIKCFLQRYGMDYTGTFAPVARLGSIRIILANAVIRGTHVHQMDVKTAFLNGDLSDDIFRDQPE